MIHRHLISLLMLSLSFAACETEPGGQDGQDFTADQTTNRELLISFIGAPEPPRPVVNSCPGPGAPPGQGYGVGMFPCSTTTECVAGLVCNYAANQDPNALPFGGGCGLCQSDLSHCPPVAPWWGNCGAPPLMACPTYVSRSVQGSGCTWGADCVSTQCDYAAPVTGFCGSCK